MSMNSHHTAYFTQWGNLKHVRSSHHFITTNFHIFIPKQHNSINRVSFRATKVDHGILWSEQISNAKGGVYSQRLFVRPTVGKITGRVVMKCSGRVDDGPRNRRLHFSDVLDSRGTNTDQRPRGFDHSVTLYCCCLYVSCLWDHVGK